MQSLQTRLLIQRLSRVMASENPVLLRVFPSPFWGSRAIHKRASTWGREMLLPSFDRSGKRSTEVWSGFLQLIEQTGFFCFSLSPNAVIRRDKTFLKTKNSQHIFKFLPPASSPSSRAGRSHHICKYVLPLMSSLSSLLLCWPLETLQGLLKQILARQKGLFFTEAATEHVCYA